MRLRRDLETQSVDDLDEEAASRWLQDVVRWLTVRATDTPDYPMQRKLRETGQDAVRLIGRLERDGYTAIETVAEVRLLLRRGGARRRDGALRAPQAAAVASAVVTRRYTVGVLTLRVRLASRLTPAAARTSTSGCRTSLNR